MENPAPGGAINRHFLGEKVYDKAAGGIMSTSVYNTLDIDVSTFITNLFPPDELNGETVLLAHPDSFEDKDGQTVNFYRQMPATQASLARVENEQRGWLYCVSTVATVPRGQKLRRRLEDIRTAWVIVLDDIGTKSEIPPVSPSFIMETSAGNFQYGYLLEPIDVSNPVNAAYFDGCLLALARAGYNDPGCRTAARVMKLPGGYHKSGFQTRVVHWAPDRGWALPELMKEMGVDPLKMRPKPVRRAVDTGVGFADVDDNIMDYLAERGLITGQRSAEWVHIHCPWEDEHTSGDPENPGSATSYSPRDYGMYGRQFRCLHGHCEGRGTNELLAWVAAEGGPVANEKRHGAMVPALFKSRERGEKR